ncbi:MAG: chaperone modulator CbpM [Alphaproteobacteria bacterium]|nr:chaperone modulator CbpM [Alphaproteobacteria bacterium]
MSVSEETLVLQVERLSVQRLHKWIRLGWVRPERHEGAPLYQEVDIARVRLLRDLELEFEFDEDTVPMVLSLLDQVHDLRHELRSIAAAIAEQPPAVRERVANAYRRIAES